MSGAAQNPGAKSQAHSDDVPASSKAAATSSSADAALDGDSNEDQQEAGGSERPTSSPEPNCAICLGQLENKSFTDSCFHMFCFVCLQEWSKVKAECPLCKQPFKSIIHNVKSYNNYDQFYLDHHPPQQQPLPFGWNFDRSFHYRTTLTMDHRYFNIGLLNSRRSASRDPSSSMPMRHHIIPLPSYRLRSRTVHGVPRHSAEPVSTTNFRRQIYESGRRVSGLRSTQRRRSVNPQFFRSNPAQTHRLVPWLNRELNALLYNVENQVTFVLELIMDLIKRFPINSDEFYEHIHPYLHHNTRHFMHEFMYFARSPYTMHTYDVKATYDEPSHTISSSNSSSNDNSDVVVVVDDDDDDVTSPPGRHHPATASPWHSPPSHAMLHSSTNSMLAHSHWDSPTPGPSWDLGGNSSHSPVNVEDSSDSDASTIIDPTYVAPDVDGDLPARLPSPRISDGEEVIFVSYDKPWEERSPIQLSSDSDNESFSYFVKALKQETKRRSKATAATSTSQTTHQSRSRDHGSRSESPASSAAYLRLPCHQSTDLEHRVSSSGKSRHDRHHKRKHSRDNSEGRHHSSRSGHKEKRKNSHSHCKLPPKKRRSERGERDGDSAGTDTSHKKHKHKKQHRKNRERGDRERSDKEKGDKEKGDKERADKLSKRRTSSNRRASESATSSTGAERADHCKKHPSGHKKSRVKNLSAGHESEAKEGSSGHHSDGLLSDTSSSSSGSTGTTTSLTDTDPGSSRRFSRQERVQQVLQERHRQSFLPMFPGLDPSWENISRLASLLASQTTAQLASLPGPSQSSSDPVVISESSDDSDIEACDVGQEGGPVNSDNMHVAKTVVVPCSSNPEVPTAAIDVAATPATPKDDYIDVDSISSEDDMSANDVDVVSVGDTDSSFELDVSDITPAPTHSTSVTEVSADIGDILSPDSDIVSPPQKRTHSSVLPFSIQSILNKDVFMGVDPSSQPFSTQTSSSSVNMSSQDLTPSHSHQQSMDILPSVREDAAQMNQRAVDFIFQLGKCNYRRHRPSTNLPSLFSQQSADDAVNRNSAQETDSRVKDGEVPSTTGSSTADVVDETQSERDMDTASSKSSLQSAQECRQTEESAVKDVDEQNDSNQAGVLSNLDEANKTSDADIQDIAPVLSDDKPTNEDGGMESRDHTQHSNQSWTSLDKEEDLLNDSADLDLIEKEMLSEDVNIGDLKKDEENCLAPSDATIPDEIEKSEIEKSESSDLLLDHSMSASQDANESKLASPTKEENNADYTPLTNPVNGFHSPSISSDDDLNDCDFSKSENPLSMNSSVLSSDSCAESKHDRSSVVFSDADPATDCPDPSVDRIKSASVRNVNVDVNNQCLSLQTDQMPGLSSDEENLR